MKNAPRPYTPDSLAERWECSERHIRALVKKGELTCFRIGKLIRISVSEVERYERGECEIYDLEFSGGNTALSGPMGTLAAPASAQQTRQRPSEGLPSGKIASISRAVRQNQP
ncbi:MAG: helix-turn-helix domain-containing protein [Alphaproteobacteria bacterium]